MNNTCHSVAFARKLGVTSLLAAFITLASAPGVVHAQSASNPGTAPTSSDAYQTALHYVTTFYPLWFTYNQSLRGTPNQLIGPRTVTPIYQTVVAINVDTLYASSSMQLPSNDAAILTIPSTNVVYSVLILDPYGNILPTGVTFNPGLYVFEGPGYDKSQALPAGVTEVKLCVDHPTIIFRADKFSSNGTDQTQEAETFRSSLQLQSLSDYLLPNPPSSKAKIVPELIYAVPYKTIADTEVAINPLLFLSQLQEAVASPRTPSLSSEEAALSDHFNELFNGGASASDLAAGAQAAHRQIVQNYLNHRDASGWIDFTNIGHWGSDVIDRASITEFLQYGNDFTAAAYFHVFVDGNGEELDGSNSHSYVIHFPAGQPPAAKRFWSITAYTPEAIELVPNELQKYNIASYTPGLEYNSDGSLTIYLGTSKSAGAPDANYLPAPPRKFNLMLRFYGPQGQVAAQAYVPPPVVREY